MRIELDEVRRLTGPNLLWDEPGAIVDVLLDGVDHQEVAKRWQSWMDKILAAFGWQESHTYRVHELGASMALSAPMDALYTACELAELAWDCCAAELTNQPVPELTNRLQELKNELAEEVNPSLLAMMEEAKRHGVDCISDDDDVSLGMGAQAQVWPARALPDVQTIDWSQYRSIPRAFITGTNGKSTSVRLAAQIAKCAGICAGVTSTDFIRVGEDIIDTGDYSGPGGARMLLRDKRTELAFLEVARGGILRRGIPVDRVNAALITNVASDHLGQYGINTVEALAQAKFVVAKGLGDKGVLVVNADNDLVVQEASKLDKTLCWFSCDEMNPLIQQQLQQGGRAVFVRGGHLVYHHNGLFEDITAISRIPMTMNGAAQHNVQNALGVVGLCKALKLPLTAIQHGLHSFGSNAEDNPGRGNIYEVQGCQVVVDFAHNEHSMRAVVNTVNQMRTGRSVVMFSHAGDRSDQEIADLTHAVADLNADRYVVAELETYLRGREVGEIPALARQTLNQRGVENRRVLEADSPLTGAQLAMSEAQAGDTVLLFVLDQREQVDQFLRGA